MGVTIEWVSIRVDEVCTDKDRTVEILAVSGQLVILYDTVLWDDMSYEAEEKLFAGRW